MGNFKKRGVTYSVGVTRERFTGGNEKEGKNSDKWKSWGERGRKQERLPAY